MLTTATPAVNPYEVAVGGQWGRAGKRIEVDVRRLEVPVPKEDIPLEARRDASGNQGPFQKTGERVKQGYFFHVPPHLWDAIRGAAGVPEADVARMLENGMVPGDPDDLEAVWNARRRKVWNRQALLREAGAGTCGVCGRDVPSRYLQAVRVRTRGGERRFGAPGGAILVCALGCERALCCGDLAVDPKGAVALSNPTDPFAAAVFGRLEGRGALAANDASEALAQVR